MKDYIYKKECKQMFELDFLDKTWVDSVDIFGISEHSNAIPDNVARVSMHEFKKENLEEIGIDDDCFTGFWMTELYVKSELISGVKVLKRHSRVIRNNEVKND